MKLHFTYNIEKDIENFINGTRAVNSKKPTKFQVAFSEKYGDNFEVEKVKDFIAEQDTITGFDASKEIVAIEERWKIAEPIFIKRMEKIFDISYPAPIITVYLTHNERCTYNIEQNYFFVIIGSEFSNNTLMHELLHFYTWHAFGKKLLDEGFSKLAYNDIKESLTELLNLEFSDLMNGKLDTGYPQHQEMRAEIKKLWLEKKGIKAIIDDILGNEKFKKQKLSELEKEDKYVFHGSESLINEFEPRQAHTIIEGQRMPDGKPAVFASPFAEYAVFMAIINKTNCPKGLRSGCSYSNRGLEFTATKTTLEQLNEQSKGFVYIFNRSDFKQKNGSEWVSYKKVKPLRFIEVHFSDLHSPIVEIPEDDSWKSYVAQTKNAKPRPLLIKAIKIVKEKNEALDLGAGALNDVRYLLDVGFQHVTAVDSQPVAQEIYEQLPKDKISYEITTFDKFLFEENKYDIINAQYSLPFNPRETFVEVWSRVINSLKSGGVFAGQLFGDRDEWNKEGRKLTFHTKEEVEQLVSRLKIVKLEEEDKEGKTAAGPVKHWHVFHFIAKKL